MSAIQIKFLHCVHYSSLKESSFILDIAEDCAFSYFLKSIATFLYIMNFFPLLKNQLIKFAWLSRIFDSYLKSKLNNIVFK